MQSLQQGTPWGTPALQRAVPCVPYWRATAMEMGQCVSPRHCCPPSPGFVSIVPQLTVPITQDCAPAPWMSGPSTLAL